MKRRRQQRTHIGGKNGKMLCGIPARFQLPINAPPMCKRCLRMFDSVYPQGPYIVTEKGVAA